MSQLTRVFQGIRIITVNKEEPLLRRLAVFVCGKIWKLIVRSNKRAMK